MYDMMQRINQDMAGVMLTLDAPHLSDKEKLIGINTILTDLLYNEVKPELERDKSKTPKLKIKYKSTPSGNCITKCHMGKRTPHGEVMIGSNTCMRCSNFIERNKEHKYIICDSVGRK